MEHEQIWQSTERARLALADLLEGLTPDQWEVESLCSGWRVREVAAHATVPARSRDFATLVALVKARGNFDRFTTQDARERASRSTEQLVSDLRAVAGVRRHPLGAKPVDPLGDVLVHTQDVAVPLGLDVAMPIEPGRAVADRLWSMSFPYRARKRCDGLRLVATDAGWANGSGDEVRGPLRSIVLVLGGRAAGVDGLEGPGRDRLAATFA